MTSSSTSLNQLNETKNEIISQAVELLSRATAILSASPTRSTSEVLPPARLRPELSTGSSAQHASPASQLPTPSVESRPSCAVEDFRRSFSHFNLNLRGRNNPRTRAASSTKSRNKPYTKRETWTHDFLALSYRDTNNAPDRYVKETLQNAGLGKKKITFGKMDNMETFTNTLYKAYPKLETGGGFELLRGKPSKPRDLEYIQPPTGSGYTVPFLRNIDLGSAMVYVRPIQKNLDISPLDPMILEGMVESVGEIPKVNCCYCDSEIAMPLLREHQLQSCQQRPTTSKTLTTKESLACDDLVLLKTIVPSCTDDEIIAALLSASGDKDLAVSILVKDDDVHECQMSNDIIMLSTVSGTSAVLPEPECKPFPTGITDPLEALQKFRETVCLDAPPARIHIDRMAEDFEHDLISLYKSRNLNLKSKPKVRFSGESGVGAGPVREFFVLSLDLLQTGFTVDGQQKPLFEGQEDHKVPVYNLLLKQCGIFRAMGRMIGHSLLHGGPSVYGISPAILNYWTSESESDEYDYQNQIHVSLQDVADVELRSHITQLMHLENGEAIPVELREAINPYLNEAGLDPLTVTNTKIIADALMLFDVIEKRRHFLDDMAKGMEETSLLSFIKSNKTMLPYAFPRSAERLIDHEKLKSVIIIDSEMDGSETAMNNFIRYIDEIAEEKNNHGIGTRDLLCFWTGSDNLPPPAEKLTVLFPEDSPTKTTPFANTCFREIIIPVVHDTYEAFSQVMDTCLKLGVAGFSEI